MRLEPGSTPEHDLDAGQIFHSTEWIGNLLLNAERVILREGATLVVAPGDAISLQGAEGDHFEAIWAMRAGGKAIMRNGSTDSFLLPWTV